MIAIFISAEIIGILKIRAFLFLKPKKNHQTYENYITVSPTTLSTFKKWRLYLEVYQSDDITVYYPINWTSLHIYALSLLKLAIKTYKHHIFNFSTTTLYIVQTSAKIIPLC